MQDIDKFGLNLVNLAKKENYPWASPEAAIESVMNMTPEEFIISTRAIVLDCEEGTEGVWQSIKDFGNWIVGIFRRFWNWITGNNKKEEKKIDEIQDKIKTLDKEQKNVNVGKVDPEAIKKGMGDDSTVLEFGDDGPKYVHKYWSVKPGRVTDVVSRAKIINDFIEDMLKGIEGVSTWVEFAANVDAKDILSKVNSYKTIIKMLEASANKELVLVSVDTLSEAASYNKSNYKSLSLFKDYNKQIESNLEKLKKLLDDISPRINNYSDKQVNLQKAITLYITDIYPTYKNAVRAVLNKMDVLYKTCIDRNRRSAKALQGNGESEDFDMYDEIDFDSGNETFHYIIEPFDLFEFSDGTEGFIGDAWEWFKNLISKFWNWLTGADKKVEKEVKETDASLEKLEKDLKNRKNNKNKNSGKPNKPGAGSTTKNKPNTTTSDTSSSQSQNTDTAQSSEEDKTPDSYDVPNLNYLNELNKLMYDARGSLSSIRKFLKRSKNWDTFVQKGTIDEHYNLSDGVMHELNNIQITLKSNRNKFSTSKNIQSFSYDEAMEKIKYQRDLIKKLYRMLKLDIVDATEEIKKTLESYPGITEETKGTDAFKRVMVLLTTTIPSLVKQFRISLKVIRQLVKTCTTKLGGAGESEDITYDDLIDTENNIGLESLYGFTLPKSVTSAYVYNGLEEEYQVIKKLLSECDAEANEYFDDYVFFGTEGFVDTVKLYSHKIWDAIRRFFMWIASKFSDKYKEKYEIEKLRAKLNSAVKDYANYIRYDDHHKKSSGNESLNYELDLFCITSGLESAPSSITVTDYDAMNKSIEDIAENSKDLARFTRCFIDMVSTGKANAKDFKKFITPNLISLPSKLNQVKFPGTKTITPDDIQSFRDEVNTSLDYCKEFKSIIDYMNKHKAKIDRFFENPELKDNTLAKSMIAAMNRYFVPSVKSISNILDWYIRCINTDIRKINDATR